MPDPDTNTILLHTVDADPFPVDVAGPPISSDEEGPIYLGSAVLEYGRVTMPCKIVLQSGVPEVLDAGYYQPSGYYYLLCFDDRSMQWISSSLVSEPCNAVVGGKGEDSSCIYYARDCSIYDDIAVHYAWYDSDYKVSGNNRPPINVHRLVRLTIALPGICAFRKCA